MCYDSFGFIQNYVVFLLINWEFTMSLITTLISVGSALFAVLFSLWMVKELFASNQDD